MSAANPDCFGYAGCKKYFFLSKYLNIKKVYAKAHFVSF